METEMYKELSELIYPKDLLRYFTVVQIEKKAAQDRDRDRGSLVMTIKHLICFPAITILELPYFFYHLLLNKSFIFKYKCSGYYIPTANIKAFFI